VQLMLGTMIVRGKGMSEGGSRMERKRAEVFLNYSTVHQQQLPISSCFSFPFLQSFSLSMAFDQHNSMSCSSFISDLIREVKKEHKENENTRGHL
jgi:hypothetical protein